MRRARSAGPRDPGRRPAHPGRGPVLPRTTT